MLRITEQEFETFKRHNDPEVFTEAQMNSWVEAAKETLIKSEINDFDSLSDVEKAELDNFRLELQSFIKVEVIGQHHDPLTKGLSYQTFYTRPQQVIWEESEEIVKSEDGKDEIQKSKHGHYVNTAQNTKMGRVGAEFGHAKKEGEGTRGGKVIGHTKSGNPIYETKYAIGDILTIKDKNHKMYGKKVHVQSVNRATDKGALKQHSYLVGISPKGNAEAIGESFLGFDKD
jgi:hypothetical protein